MKERSMKNKTTDTVVVAECVSCKARRVIKAGEVAPGDVPMCDKCYNPMVAVSARQRRRK